MMGFDIHMVSNRCSMKISKNLNFCLGLTSGLVPNSSVESVMLIPCYRVDS